jgi:probable addiction module antidote protein
MEKQRRNRTFREIEEEYFRKYPNEIDAYIQENFETYKEDGNAAALLASLRVIAKVKGMNNLVEATGMTRQGIEHALSDKGNPRFENFSLIMNGLGYQLKPEPIHS